MNESAKISSIQELRQRKEKVDAEMAASKQELIKSIKPTSLQAREFVLKDVVLPLLGVGIAVYAVSRLISGGRKNPQDGYPEADPRPQAEPSGFSAYGNGNGNGHYQKHVEKTGGGPKARKSRLEALVKFGSLAVPAARAIMAAVKENQD